MDAIRCWPTLVIKLFVMLGHWCQCLFYTVVALKGSLSTTQVKKKSTGLLIRAKSVGFGWICLNRRILVTLYIVGRGQNVAKVFLGLLRCSQALLRPGCRLSSIRLDDDREVVCIVNDTMTMTWHDWVCFIFPEGLALFHK